MSVDRLMTRLNPLLRWLLRSPLHGLASSGLMLLTFTGRVSGRTFTIPVGYQREGDEVTVLVSEARRKQWWRTFRNEAPAELLIRRQHYPVSGRCVAPESPAFGDIAEATLRRVPSLGRVFGVDFDATAGLSDAQRTHLATEIAIVRFRGRS